ncbi:TPA: antirestriction protein [Klebsiella aerogenes]|uniref:Antirestriction protein n=1 Tax=Klebsiella aerogenes (strain ATCC 13048 / DSM 30053 / CCUG 1429 / JCM 1235 / KCTC 2190 / NBRC 13534 / NCIMB 10102 / NCTC 10006 / CDC 819-56) TaxID=1028307 RepID=A0A0H3FJB2_KLEAK|nr:antirestriction protein [Klebsiella aerogenes]AEG95468.1 antirestriction protein [Klebsiella aerogenes KCTC 2190]KLF32792.1 phage antirestriction protein [Klebsiella aerogenes]MEC4758020.1 antirestriction protein [Klebsiella aerogenes]QEU21606.1 antirestriction protein [Klebsiella aerogenes]QXB09272.1 antirestriction protein [Klebsiella aerogenes]
MNNKLTLTSTVTESLFSPHTDAGGIVCTPVPDEQRVAFWPGHFGSIPQWIILEPTVFAWMDRFCKDYHGGIWNFYTLSNGGAFMAPEASGDDDGKWALFNNMNGNGAEMSADATGIAVCLMTYSHHAMRTECDGMTEHYYQLRGYALNHAECNAIMHIID